MLSAKLGEAGYPITRSMIANWEVQRSIVFDTYLFALCDIVRGSGLRTLSLARRAEPTNVTPIEKKK